MTSVGDSKQSSGTIVGSAAANPTLHRPGGFGLMPLWSLYLLSLRQFLHGKRPLVMLLFLLLPPGIAILLRGLRGAIDAGTLEFSLVFMLIPQALLPLTAMVYALGIVQDEQEGQTITYLLVRPIPKWGFYIVKLLATLTMALLLVAGFTALTYAAIYIGGRSATADIPLRCLKAIGVHALTVVTYCCLFGLISLVTRWTLVVCLAYTAVIELLLANLPFSIRLITVMYYARLIAYRSMSFVVDSGRGMNDIAALDWHLDTWKDPQLAEHPQISTCIAVLVCASLACAILGAVICWQKEFYVKTPEQL